MITNLLEKWCIFIFLPPRYSVKVNIKNPMELALKIFAISLLLPEILLGVYSSKNSYSIRNPGIIITNALKYTCADNASIASSL